MQNDERKLSLFHALGDLLRLFREHGFIFQMRPPDQHVAIRDDVVGQTLVRVVQTNGLDRKIRQRLKIERNLVADEIRIGFFLRRILFVPNHDADRRRLERYRETKRSDKNEFVHVYYSVFGYEPRIFTKLQCLPRILIAPTTFLSCAWPSQSMKKKYSHALRLLGRDSIFVMLILNLRNAAMASCNAPTLSETLTIRLVRSSPVGGLHWRPRTRKRVAFAALS